MPNTPEVESPEAKIMASMALANNLERTLAIGNQGNVQQMADTFSEALNYVRF